VRRGMIQLAWRFLFHQRNSALTQWYRQSVAAGKKRTTQGCSTLYTTELIG